MSKSKHEYRSVVLDSEAEMFRTFLSFVIIASFFVACGGGARVLKKQPTLAQPSAAPVVSQDPLETFKGKKHQVDETFFIYQNPVAIVGPSLILTVTRIDWTSFENGNGTVEKDGTAHILVESGDQSTTLRLDEGDDRGAFGWRVHLIKVEDIFREGRGDYVPQVTLRVSR